MESVYVKKTDLELLSTIENNSVDLVLTDPPYIISRKSGMQSYKNSLEKGGKVDEKFGKKYAITTEFGEWDNSYTIDDLEKAINEFYRILKSGGSCIIFFDVWKIESLTNLLSKFSKHRFVEWIKTNPMPVNQYATYLSNAREIAISCVKVVRQHLTVNMIMEFMIIQYMAEKIDFILLKNLYRCLRN